jgi:hypothetical protein
VVRSPSELTVSHTLAPSPLLARAFRPLGGRQVDHEDERKNDRTS